MQRSPRDRSSGPQAGRLPGSPAGGCYFLACGSQRRKLPVRRIDDQRGLIARALSEVLPGVVVGAAHVGVGSAVPAVFVFALDDSLGNIQPLLYRSNRLCRRIPPGVPAASASRSSKRPANRACRPAVRGGVKLFSCLRRSGLRRGRWVCATAGTITMTAPTTKEPRNLITKPSSWRSDESSFASIILSFPRGVRSIVTGW